MNPMTFREVRQATGARALAPIADDLPRIRTVCTDTRHMEADSLFVALRGDQFDAHEFLAQAASGGAIAAVVEHPPADPVAGLLLFLAPDSRVALGKLARFVRQQLRGKVIAVAGSNGKTSTKFLIDACLKGRLRGTMSPKSFNNDIGVPLAIFPADPSQDYLVLEMGTNHPGEIRVLSEMALPDIAVLTNCGLEHLEGLGDLMGVRRENASITAGLNPKGTLIANGDDPELLPLLRDYPGQHLTFGFKSTNDFFATDVTCSQRGTEFSVNGSRRRAFVPMLGRHAAANALAAIAVARKLGVPEDQILENLAAARGPDMRLQVQELDGLTLINDAYNANPNSMRAAIETLVALPASGRRVAVLGDMLELGPASDRYHREIGDFLALHGPLDLLVCVGAQGEKITDAAVAGGFSNERVLRYPNSQAAATDIGRHLRPDDTVLLKASRGMRLEKVAAALSQPPAPAPIRLA